MFGDKKIKIKDSERSLISETVSIEGTINSSGAIDVAGLVKGPVYSKEIIIRETGSITGSIEGEHVEIHGHLDGKVSAQNMVLSSLSGRTVCCNHRGSLRYWILHGILMDSRKMRNFNLQKDQVGGWYRQFGCAKK